jgi:glycosyltransferase involved in cell wall biosynthesis
MSVHQLLAAAAPADAVTGQALAWRRVLAAGGVGGEIYAEHVHPALAGRVRPLEELARDGGPVLLHYSIWSRAVARAAEVPAGRLGVVYHNVTPGHLLADSNPALAELCDRGRRELPSLADRARVAVADSAYNARDLRAAGYPEPVVVPLLLDLPEPPPPRREVPPTVLYVGRIAPSKRIEDLIRAVAVLGGLLPGARLELIGSADGFAGYRAALERLADDLGVGEATTFRGRVDDRERDRAYAAAGAYCSMSAHEGFCAPLLEALAHGLPVVALGAGAVAETLGGAGLVLPERDPALAAEALLAALTDPDLRAAFDERARVRLAGLAPALVERRMRAAAAPLVG